MSHRRGGLSNGLKAIMDITIAAIGRVVSRRYPSINNMGGGKQHSSWSFRRDSSSDADFQFIAMAVESEAINSV